MRVNRVKRLVYIALLLLVALCAPLAQAFDSAWTQKAVVTLDATYIDEAPVIVPIYLSGFDSTWWSAVQADGDDIRVTEDDETTERDYVLWKIDTGTSTGLIVVNVDGYASASVDVDLVVFAGNAGASAGSTTDTFSSTGYVGVYAPGVSTTDYSGNGRTLTAVNSPGTAAVSALEMDAATYDGSTSYHKYEGTLGVTNWPITIEAIANSTDTANNQSVVTISAGSTINDFAQIRFRGNVANDPVGAYFIGASGSSSAPNATAVPGYSSGVYNYSVAARTANTGTSYSYVNGANQGTNATTLATPTAFDELAIGAIVPLTSTKLTGSVVFIALSDSVRSANYVATMYDAWNTSAFRTYGATASNGGATGHPWFYWRYRA